MQRAELRLVRRSLGRQGKRRLPFRVLDSWRIVAVFDDPTVALDELVSNQLFAISSAVAQAEDISQGMLGEATCPLGILGARWTNRESALPFP